MLTWRGTLGKDSAAKPKLSYNFNKHCKPKFLSMPVPEPFLLGGSIIGIIAVSAATFVGVSYLEVRDKINQQIIAGEDPYELKVEEKQRKKPPQKKKSSGRRK